MLPRTFFWSQYDSAEIVQLLFWLDCVDTLEFTGISKDPAGSTIQRGTDEPTDD